MEPGLTIGLPPEPRQQDVDTFTVWLKEHEVDPVVPSKIRCTAETLDSLALPGRPPKYRGTIGDKAQWFVQDWRLVYDFGDYRLMYDGRAERL